MAARKPKTPWVCPRCLIPLREPGLREAQAKSPTQTDGKTHICYWCVNNEKWRVKWEYRLHQPSEWPLSGRQQWSGLG